jgi:ABC-type multidrug transport system ATPase subunit
MSQVEEVSEDHELLGHDAAVLEMPESTRMVLEWKDLHYSVKNKEILKGVSGAAYPGELLALMGPSGSGKSTLLGLLSGKIPSTSKMTGHLAANGERFGKRYSKESVGFVHQEDMLLPNHSVLETFQFSADLRLPKSMSPKERLERIEQVISILRLAHVKNSQIGGPFKRGVSGGERKRVSVGLELIRNVSVLLLDEPT